MAYLRYLDDSGQLQTKLLDSEHFLIGRAATCNLTLESEKISREHLRIDLEGDGRYRACDLGSRNRTYVNGELITETLLTSGAIIRVGDRIVEFVDETIRPKGIDFEFLTPDESEPDDCEWIRIKAPLSLTASQIEQLSQLVSDQPLTARAEDVADAALGQIVLDLGAERGLIALRGNEEAQLRPLAHRALKKSTGGSMTPVSESFVMAALLQRVAGRYPTTAAKIKTKLGYAPMALVAPMAHGGEIIGVLYVDRLSGKKPFSSAALQYCAAAGAHVGALLGESSRKLGRFAGREGAAWMSAIRRVQASLTSPATSSDAFDVAMRCYPGRYRCGDFTTVVHVDEQRCGVIVIDGGGHGITGITQSSAIRAAMETAAAVSEDVVTDPAMMFNAVNRLVASMGARQIIPCLFLGIDLPAGRISYINAGGMPPLLMMGPGRLVTLDQMSLILGVDADYSYGAAQTDLVEAFRLVCYTDGLPEATGGSGRFGAERLQKTLLECDAYGKASEFVSAVDRAWTTHIGAAQATDDATILVVGHG